MGALYAQYLGALALKEIPMPVYDKSAPKRAVNVSVNADLAAKAKALGVNLSETLETRLAELVAAAERQQWLAENAAAIEAYNKRVEEETIVSDVELHF
jgi:antitoxin CcdA